MALSRPAWHHDKDVNSAVQDFCQKYAKRPDSAQARGKLRECLDITQNHFQHQGAPCRGYEFVATMRREVLDLDAADFRVYMIMDCKGCDAKPTEACGCYFLRPRLGGQWPYLQSALTTSGYLSADRMAHKYQAYVDTLRETFTGIEGVDFEKYGRDIRMTVKQGDSCWFSVDLVQVFIVGGHYYHTGTNCHQHPDAWGRSLSQEASDWMDPSNGRRKQVLRMLEVLCGRDGVLKQLSPFQRKMLLFSELQEHSEKTWGSRELALRLLDLLARLELYMTQENDHFSHYFLPKGTPDHDMSANYMNRMRIQIQQRVNDLYNSKAVFMEALRMSGEDDNSLPNSIPPSAKPDNLSQKLKNCLLAFVALVVLSLLVIFHGYFMINVFVAIVHVLKGWSIFVLVLYFLLVFGCYKCAKKPRSATCTTGPGYQPISQNIGQRGDTGEEIV